MSDATDTLLRIKHVLERIPVSRNTLHRWRASGVFPAPVRIGKNGTPMWRQSDIDEFIGRLDHAE